MRKYELEILTKKEIESLSADLGENEIIVETAGFVPLEVKFKRFEQNGMIAQFNSSEFTSADMRNLYLNPDFDISPEDDLEDIQEKLLQMQQFQNDYITNKKSPPSGEIEKEGELSDLKKTTEEDKESE